MRSSESHLISITTATMALFDETGLAARRSELQWYAHRKKVLSEIRKGRLVTLDLPMSGVYSVRFTKRGLRPKEEAVASPLACTWIDVPTGQLECADLGCVPSLRDRPPFEGERASISLPPGRYALQLWTLPLENEPRSDPHLVIHVRPIEEGERAPRRTVSPITPWKVQTRPRRRALAHNASSKHPEIDTLLRGRLSISGSLVLFDPGDTARFEGRPRGWANDEDALQESMQRGDLVWVRASGRRLVVAELAVAKGELPRSILSRARRVRTGRLAIRSGTVSVGGMDRIPLAPQRRRPLQKWTAAIPPGDYRVWVAAMAHRRMPPATGEFFIGLQPCCQRFRVDMPPDVFSAK